MKNTLSATGTARQPRSVVRVNGTVLTGFDSWEIENNTFYAADTFMVSFPVSGLPSANNVAWFASQTEISIEILIGFPSDPTNYTAADLQSFITGNVDDVEWSLDGFRLSVSGRDKTAALIDTKTSQKYPNLTASQIATMLAAKYGLTPVVTGTTTKVGKYYEIDHVRLQDERTEWDLLTWLAREEQFVVFVQGNELHFQPQPSESQDPYVLEWKPATAGQPIVSANAARISVSKNFTIAKGIVVTVTSWNSKKKAAYTRQATSTGGAGKNPQKYSYRIAGLTPDQAQQRANQLLSDISKHQVKLSVDGPADNLLGMADVIRLQGTGTAFDQVFYPDTISREFSVDDGYRWRVEAKNHSPQSEPVV